MNNVDILTEILYIVVISGNSEDFINLTMLNNSTYKLCCDRFFWYNIFTNHKLVLPNFHYNIPKHWLIHYNKEHMISSQINKFLAILKDPLPEHFYLSESEKQYEYTEDILKWYKLIYIDSKNFPFNMITYLNIDNINNQIITIKWNEYLLNCELYKYLLSPEFNICYINDNTYEIKFFFREFNILNDPCYNINRCEMCKLLHCIFSAGAHPHNYYNHKMIL